MANIQIAIKDEGSARAWLDKVMLTNEDFNTAMREAGETLQATKDFGEGTLIDEFYDAGTMVLTTAQKVFDTINEISTVVNDVINKVTNLSGVVEGAVKAFKNIFG